jgi:hypothetical protein
VVRRADGKLAVLFDNRDRQTAPRPSASRDREPRAPTVNRVSERGHGADPVAAGSGRRPPPPDPKRTDFMYEKPCRRSQSASGIVDAETSRTALSVGQGGRAPSVLFLQPTASRRRPNDTHVRQSRRRPHNICRIMAKRCGHYIRPRQPDRLIL